MTDIRNAIENQRLDSFSENFYKQQGL